MFSVVKNVFDVFQLEEDGLSLREAIDICSDVISRSSGGEAYIVSDGTAGKIVGEDCSLWLPFAAYGTDGKPFPVD